jgi:hypothetical protein
VSEYFNLSKGGFMKGGFMKGGFMKGGFMKGGYMNGEMFPMKWVAPLLISLVIGICFSNPAAAGFYLREEARPMWVKADTDHDGFLSRDEVGIEDPGMLQGFDDADVNCDGRLNLGEFEILLISL